MNILPSVSSVSSVVNLPVDPQITLMNIKTRIKELAAKSDAVREFARIPVRGGHYEVGDFFKVLGKPSLRVSDKKSLDQIAAQGERIVQKAGTAGWKRAATANNANSMAPEMLWWKGEQARWQDPSLRKRSVVGMLAMRASS